MKIPILFSDINRREAIKRVRLSTPLAIIFLTLILVGQVFSVRAETPDTLDVVPMSKSEHTVFLSQVLQSEPEREKLQDEKAILESYDVTTGRMRTLVSLNDDSKLVNWKGESEKETNRKRIDQLQDLVIKKLNPSASKVHARFDNVAGFAVEIDSAGLLDLMADPNVKFISPEREYYRQTAQGIPLIKGEAVRSSYNGSGVTIAVIDSGIDYNHPALGAGGYPNSKVIGGYDYANEDSDPYPSGESGAHGTCCAGIAAGDIVVEGDYIGGVANGSKLVALKVFSDAGGGAYSSTIISAIDWCVTFQQLDPSNPIMVISMSIGGGRHIRECDEEEVLATEVVQAAVSAGITVLAASGNDGYCNAMSWPACMTNVISVGATYDANIGSYETCIREGTCYVETEPTTYSCGYMSKAVVDGTTEAKKVTCYTNSVYFLDLLAPSTYVTTPDILDGGGYDNDDYFTEFGGTSAACPYAAGSVAILQSVSKALNDQYLPPEEIRNLLMSTGELVTDTKNGGASITNPFIDIQAAHDLLVSSLPIATPSPTPSPTPESGDDLYEPNDYSLDAYDLTGYNAVWLESINGLGIMNDQDYYKIEILPGQYDFNLKCNIRSPYSSLQSFLLAFVDTSGNSVGHTFCDSSSASLELTLDSAGIYYIRVDPNYNNQHFYYDLFWEAKIDESATPTPSPTPSPTPYFPSVFRVDDDISDGGYGQSWETAFSTIQEAVEAAYSNGGGEVWVAEGFYKLDDVAATIPIVEMREGVDIYGGFSGNETDLGQRDWKEHSSTIDGQWTNQCVLGADNAILDGLIILNGNERYGGGLANYHTSPLIRNCRFKGNKAYYGAGIYNSNSRAVIANCYFVENTSSDEGGGINSEFSLLTVDGCIFKNNTSKSNGGGVYNADSAIANISNCTFVKNVAAAGGAIYTEHESTVENCIFWDNILGIEGDGTTTVSYSCVQYGYPGVGNFDLNPQFDEISCQLLQDSPCIDAGNPEWNGLFEVDIVGAPRVSNLRIDIGACEFVPGTSVGDVQINLEPEEVRGLYPRWRIENGSWMTSDDIVKLYPGDYQIEFSPIANWQKPLETTISVTFSGYMGTFEYIATPGKDVCYVDVNATGLNNGSSWSDAFTDLQQAVDTIFNGEILEVWVAQGTYTVPDGDEVLRMKEYVHLYGGFSGNEVARYERNWSENRTIIDGEELRRCVVGADHTILDGFIIEHGYSEGDGGGMFNTSCSPTVTNCIFRNNYSMKSGGGLFNGFNANPIFTNCLFVENTSHISGGAIYSMYFSTFVNCTIVNNNSGTYGDFNTNSSIKAENCILWGNRSLPKRYVEDSDIKYSCVQRGYGGTGNIDTEPLLDPVDFRPLPLSPCIDSGYSLTPSLPEKDFRNQSRIMNDKVDMGFCEYTPDLHSVLFTVSLQPGEVAPLHPQWRLDSGPWFDEDVPIELHPGEYHVEFSKVVDWQEPEPTTISVTSTHDSDTFIYTQDSGNYRWYVNTAAQGDQTGTSWGDAFADIQSAINMCENDGFGEIWVAEGTYTSASDAVVTLGEGVCLFGGFVGNETELNQRDWEKNKTIIDGEKSRRCILGANNTLVDGFMIQFGYTEGNGGGMYNRRNISVVKNCTFYRNAALGTGGMYNEEFSIVTLIGCSFLENISLGDTISGGGMAFNWGCFVQADGCRFIGNVSRNSNGGGVYSYGSCEAEFTGCLFANNVASYSGGGLAFDGVKIKITDCIFSSNVSGRSAGGLGLWGCEAVLQNTSIVDNRSGLNVNYIIDSNEYSGLYLSDVIGDIKNTIVWKSDLLLQGENELDITYSCIEGGYEGEGNIDMDPMFDPVSYCLLPGSPCIDSGDLDTSDLSEYDFPGRARVQNSRVDMGACETVPGAVPVDVVVTLGPETVLSSTPKWRVNHGPWLSSGDVIQVYPGEYQLQFGWLGNWQEPGETTIEVLESGFNESYLYTEKPGNKIWYVDLNATGDNTGQSWQDAFTGLNAAIDTAYYYGGGEVWVRTGVYTETEGHVSIYTLDVEYIVELESGVHLYGGFNGDETLKEQRDWKLNQTVIDGQNNGQYDEDNFRMGMIVFNGIKDVLVDGFFMSHCSAYNGGGIDILQGASVVVQNCSFSDCISRHGGGLYNDCFSNTLLKDCYFSGNNVIFQGGGVYNASYASLRVSDCQFLGNEAENTSSTASGGGLYNSLHGNLKVETSVFRNNKCNYHGAGFSSYSASVDVIGCLFEGNGMDDVGLGGAIYLFRNDSANIKDCIFRSNIARRAAGIGAYDSYATISNCIFNNNVSKYKGSAVYHYGSSWLTHSIKMINCTIAGNQTTYDDPDSIRAAIVGSSSTKINITNSILWENSPEQFHSCWRSHSCIQDDYDGISFFDGIIDEDPLFVDPENGDYSLMRRSPCIDSGTSEGAPETDILGVQRPIRHGYDMGAYELNDLLPIAFAKDITITLDEAGIASITVDDIDNGSNDDVELVSRTLSQDTFTCDDLGDNTVSLTVGDIDGNTDSCTFIVTVLAYAPPVISLVGDETIELQYGIPYRDPGAIAVDDCGTSVSVTIDDGNVNIFEVGTYTVEYNAVDVTGLAAETVTRTVEVVAVWRDVWFVDDDSSDLYADGGSWFNAFNSIQLAIDSAAAAGASGDNPCEVWVAQGTYSGLGGLPIIDGYNSYSSECVVIMAEGVYLYGGFSGGETVRGERDWVANRTEIDGEELRRCVFGADSSRLDGFVVKNGRALDDDVFYGRFGGGLLIYNASPDIVNCIFSTNIADYGGALYCRLSNCQLINCLMIQNDAVSDASCIFSGNSSPSLNSCTIYVEENSHTAGNVFSYCISPSIVNSIIWGSDETNVINDSGATVTVSSSCIKGGFSGEGNISVDPGFKDLETMDFTLSKYSPCIDTGTPENAPTIDLNGITRPSRNGYDMGAYELNYQLPIARVRNLVLELDDTGTAMITVDDVDAGSDDDIALISRRISRNTFTCDDIGDHLVTLTVEDADGNMDSQDANITVVDSAPPVMTSIGDLDIILEFGSDYHDPGVLVTDNCDEDVSVVIGGDVVDVFHAGVYQVTYNASDVYGNVAPTIIRTISVEVPWRDRWYVDINNTSGQYHGESWENALHNIQIAVDAAVYSGASKDNPTEIWVADGSYTGLGETVYYGEDLVGECIVRLKEGISLYGGFEGHETTLTQRDWRLHKSIIDGEGIRRGIIGSNESVFDGFTVTDGMAYKDYDPTLSVYAQEGGGILFLNCSGVVSNCIVENCQAMYGAGICCRRSSPDISNCIISNNSSTRYGGGIYSIIQSQPVLTNCVIVENRATSNGGGVMNTSVSTPFFMNCTFSYNSGYHGGAVYGQTISPSTLVNCILWGNSSQIGSNEIYRLNTGSESEVTFSCIDGGYEGEGNIDLDPLFTDPDSGLYTLQPDSPCIDSASDAGAPAVDLRGEVRPQWRGYDMGAYEYSSNIPIARAQDIIVELDASGAASIAVDDIDNGSDDDIALVSRMLSQESFDCSHLGENTVTLTVEDADGNTDNCTATVTVLDVTAPVITLNGEAEVFLEYGQSFIDPGAEASDSCDSELSITIGGDTVDGYAVGDYVITYNCSDESDNTAIEQTRTVHVVRVIHDVWTIK